MAALKDDLIQWDSGCTAFDQGNFNGALDLFEPIADTSRIHYNMAVAFMCMRLDDDAINSLTRAIACDQFLAVAYFQRGVLFYRQKLYTEALADFTDALKHLRGNLLIDYTQLGLAYKLFACEVSFNRGLAFICVNQVDAGMADFDDAARTRPLDPAQPQHARIEEGLDLNARAPNYCRPFEVPLKVLFKPPPGKMKNTKKVEYLNKSRVVASVDETDNFAGFSGTKIKNETMSRKTAGPLDDHAFAASTTISRKKSLGAVDEPVPASSAGMNRRPTIADTRAATLQRLNSTRTGGGPSAAATTPPRTTSPEKSSELSRSGSARGAGPSGPGPIRNGSVSRKTSDDGYPDSGYSGGGRRPSTSNGPGYDSSPSVSRNNSTRDYDRGRGNGDFEQSRGRAQSGNRGGDDYGARARSKDGARSDDISRRNTQMSIASSISAGDKFKIKCHFNDTRMILVPVEVTFDDLTSRIQKKFAASGPLKLKYRDPDNEMVLITDQEDLEIAFEMSGIEYGVVGGQQDNKFEIWCFQ